MHTGAYGCRCMCPRATHRRPLEIHRRQIIAGGACAQPIIAQSAIHSCSVHDLSSTLLYRRCPVQLVTTFPRPVVARGTGTLMPTSNPGRRRRNEERTWGFGARGISEGLGAFGVGGISKGLRAWAPSRNAISS